MALFQRELTVVLAAYLLAGIPVGAILVASRLSPFYRIPSGYLCRWWSRFALVIVVVSIAISVPG